MRKIEYIITENENGKTVERFFKSKGYSSALITNLKKTEKGVLLNGEAVYVVATIKTGDRLFVSIGDEENSENITPIDLGFDVLFEDEDYIIYDKPAGVVVHPTKVYQTQTIGNDFMYRCNKRGEKALFRPVYRIDRNTSGVVVIAKNKLSAATCFDKNYICICNGKLDESGFFDQPIGLCDGSKIKRTVRVDGQTALTEYKLLAYNNGYSVAQVKLHTGRTHQIRTHFSCNGFALVGDTLYGTETEGISRHALHCASVSFKHIVTGENITLQSKLPPDMCFFLKKNNISY